MRKAILSFVYAICIFIAITSYADTIVLKSGKQIEAKIIEKTTDFIKVDIGGVPITYYLDEIETINGERVQAVKEKEPLLETTTQTQSLVSETTEVVPEKPLPGLTETTEPISEPSEEFEQSEIKPSRRLPTDIEPKTAAVLATAFADIFGFIIVIFIVTYVYTALCLYFIAKKTQQQSAWLAWIPLANLFLMCKIGGLSYLWLLFWLFLFLLGFVGPIISLITTLGNFVLFGFIWYKIALARNKPAWMGILTVLPLVGLVFIGLLAFSD